MATSTVRRSRCHWTGTIPRGRRSPWHSRNMQPTRHTALARGIGLAKDRGPRSSSTLAAPVDRARRCSTTSRLTSSPTTTSSDGTPVARGSPLRCGAAPTPRPTPSTPWISPHTVRPSGMRSPRAPKPSPSSAGRLPGPCSTTSRPSTRPVTSTTCDIWWAMGNSPTWASPTGRTWERCTPSCTRNESGAWCSTRPSTSRPRNHRVSRRSSTSRSTSSPRGVPSRGRVVRSRAPPTRSSTRPRVFSITWEAGVSRCVP